MTTSQKVLLTATVLALAGLAFYAARQGARLRDQVRMFDQRQAQLEEQITQLKSQNQSLAHRIGQTQPTAPLNSDRLRELLRLRGEVGVLRRRQHELETQLADARSRPSPPTSQPAPEAQPPPVAPAPFQLQLVLDEPAEDAEWITNHTADRADTLRVQKTPLMDYTAIQAAAVAADPVSGMPQINVEFNEVGKELFAAVTRENLNKRLAMVLDGQVYAAPVIRSEISGGKAQITGHFTEAEARGLVARINEAIRAP